MTENRLSTDGRKALLKIARDTIESYAQGGGKPPLPSSPSSELEARQGAFVTLHQRGRLRGCIGTFLGEGPLVQTVQNMAVAAGWEDPRFGQLSEDELSGIDIEISVLSPLREIKDISEIEVGKHGIYITKGINRGVLLPQVAVEQGWDRDTFLSHTCIKAGLPPETWKGQDLKIEVFSAEVFGEKDLE